MQNDVLHKLQIVLLFNEIYRPELSTVAKRRQSMSQKDKDHFSKKENASDSDDDLWIGNKALTQGQEHEEIARFLESEDEEGTDHPKREQGCLILRFLHMPLTLPQMIAVSVAETILISTIWILNSHPIISFLADIFKRLSCM
ncbi:MAG: hypothetical protein WCO30_01480 [bacterium]